MTKHQWELNKYNKSYFELFETLFPRGRQPRHQTVNEQWKRRPIHVGHNFSCNFFLFFFFFSFCSIPSFLFRVRFDLYCNEFNSLGVNMFNTNESKLRERALCVLLLCWLPVEIVARKGNCRISCQWRKINLFCVSGRLATDKSDHFACIEIKLSLVAQTSDEESE